MLTRAAGSFFDTNAIILFHEQYVDFNRISTSQNNVMQFSQCSLEKIIDKDKDNRGILERQYHLECQTEGSQLRQSHAI